MDLSLVVVSWLAGALMGVVAAERRGFSYLAGILGGLLLGPLAFLMLFASSSRRRCPACAEFVHKQAIVCRHCQHTLTPEALPWRTRTANRSVTINDVLNAAIVLVALAIVIVVAERGLPF